ncbi:MAG: helix-turn-helix transcriptional regulator [Alphaproteobacteria bacterium]|nr:helix-turn-helix transcriptional regulator [Alphaproteobacteria bacterium]
MSKLAKDHAGNSPSRIDVRARLADVVRDVYDALLLERSSAWSDIAARIAGAFGAPIATILFYPDGDEAAHSLARFGQSPESAKSYEDYYGRIDPGRRACPTDGTPLVAAYSHISRNKEWMREEFVTDYAAPRIDHLLAAVLPKGRGGFFAFTVARGKGMPPFDPALLAPFRELAGYWLHAVRLSQSVRPAGAAVPAELPLLDAWSHGIALLDREGSVAHLNPAALGVINGKGAVTQRGDRLAARNYSDQSRLERALNAVLSRAAPAASAVLTGAGRPALTLTVVALTAGAAAKGPVAAVIFGNGRPSIEALAEMFGLTRGERAVASRMLLGERVPSIAAALGVGAETVRTHLQHMFRKTGAQSQHDFVRILLTSAAAALGSGRTAEPPRRG